MAIQNADAIQKLYVAYFNRPADYYGLEYWDKIVTAANGDTSAVSAAFAGSAEYQATYAGMDLRNTINAIYKNLFGHSADIAGLDFWTNAVQSGAMTMSNAVTSIAAGAQGADKVAYDSKVAAATAFTNALNTTDEILGYSGEKANAAAKQFIAGVTDAATLATAITPANLDASINGVIGAGATAQTYQLTKGLDSITGTSGNDVIIGSIDAAGSELNTFNSVDLINGGTGIDTLKIAQAAAGAISLTNLSNVEVVEVTSAVGVSVDSTTSTGVTDLNVVRAAGTVSATAGATTNVGVSLKDAAAIGSISVIGGKNVNIATTDSVSAINVGVGAADPVGAVVVSATGAAAVVGVATTTMGNITVEGGSTVSVTQKATVSSAALQADAVAEAIVQGNVSITAGANTTDVTVKQDATNDGAYSRAAIAGATEVATVKFAALKATESVTVAGLTFRANKDLTAAEVAQAFANVTTAAIKPTQLTPAVLAATGDTNGSSVAANGTFSGSLVSAGFAVDGTTAALSSWASGAANGDTVTFTGRANTDQTNIAVSTTAATAPVVTTTTQGVTARSAWNDLGVTAGSVAVTGGAALKTVTVDGYDGVSGIAGAANAALATVTLANGGNFNIASAASTLALNATDVDGTVNVAAGTKTINANVAGATSTVTLTSASADVVNVKGTGNVAGNTGTGLTVATAINTSEMTAGTATFTIADGGTTSYTGGAASDSVTIASAGTAITKAVSLGAGNDTLTLQGTVVAPTATLSGGEGTDTIAMNGASAAALSANGDFATKIDGFEKLWINDTVSTATTVNMANMDGINYVVSSNSTATGTAPVAEQQKFVLALAEAQTAVVSGTAAAVGEQQSFTVAGTATAAGTIDVMGVPVTVNSGATAADVAAAIAAAESAITTANSNVASVTATGGVVTITYTTAAGNVTPLAAVAPAAAGITAGAVTETRAFDSNAGNITINAGGTAVAIPVTAGMTAIQVGAAILGKTADIKAANPNVDTISFDNTTGTLKLTYKASAGDVAPFTLVNTDDVGLTVGTVASQYGIQAGTITVAGVNFTTTNGQTVDQLGALIASQEAAIKTASSNTVDTVTYDAATDTVLVTYTTAAANATEATVTVNPGVGIAGGTFTESRAYAGTSAGVPSLTIDKMVNDSTVELRANGNGVNVKMADATGATDSLNIVTRVVSSDLGLGTVNVTGVETIKVNATDAQPVNPSTGAASIQTATLAVNAAGATSVVVTGNSHLTLSLGADAKTVASVDASALTGNLSFTSNASNIADVVAVTVTGGAGNDTLRASAGTNAKADVLVGGAGADVLYAGSNGATLTGGAGNDLFIVGATSIETGNKEINTYSTITDFSAGDLLQLRAFTNGAAADVSNLGKLAASLNESTASFSNFVEAAIAQADLGAAVWFNFKGDLYVVIDNGVTNDNLATFTNGEDVIVKLTGINGDNLTWNTEFGTGALI